MKSHISVLVPSNSAGVEAAFVGVLEKYRLVEDDLESIRAHHWDYWCFPSDERFDDTEIARDYPEESAEIRAHSSYVRNLPDDYLTSAIVSRDLGWVDVLDFGWRMGDRGSEKNEVAMKKWRARMRQILSEHSGMICVQAITHR